MARLSGVRMLKVREVMSQSKWLYFVVFSLIFAGNFVHAQDGFPDAPPADDAFQGAPPMGGQMPGSMKDLRDLMQWKKDHQSDPSVQAFDQSHGELPKPTFGQAPDPSQIQKMQQYISDLKALKKTVDAGQKQTTALDVATQCQPTTSPELQTQVQDLQKQVTQMTQKLDSSQQPPSFAPGAAHPNGFPSSDQLSIKCRQPLILLAM